MGLSQLTGDDIKAMIQRRIDMKQKEIEPVQKARSINLLIPLLFSFLGQVARPNFDL